MNTKEKVLQKCRTAWNAQDDPKVNGYSIHANSGGWYDIRSEGGSIHYKAYEGYPDDDPVWSLAAQVLGIGEGAVSKDDLVAQLCEAKEKEDNRIDLNAFAVGLIAMYDAIVNPKPNEV